MFGKQFFINNRRKLLDDTKMEVILVAANDLMQRSGDTQFPFRQDSYFWYLCGINEPSATLVLTPKKAFLVTKHQDRFDLIASGRVNKGALKNSSGLDEVFDNKLGWTEIKNLLKSTDKVGIVSPARAGDSFVTENMARKKLQRRLKSINSKISLVDVRPSLVKSRMIKQPVEIKAIQRAVNITVEAFSALPSFMKTDPKYEYQVQGFIESIFKSHGAENSYSPIVACGGNARAIHYVANNSKLVPGQTLLIDIGAEVSGYASDITRTMVIGKPSQRQQEVIQAVADVQKYALSLVKPGVTRRELEISTENYMGNALISLGVIKNKTRRQIRQYFSHAVTHFMGLDVHDVADYSLPLAENMVLTVEPGIYIPEENIGVRIEDNVLVTKRGCRVLSKNLPSVL